MGIVNGVAMIVRGPRRVRQRCMVEMRVDGVREVRTAYNEEEIDLHVVVTGPAGLSTAVPVFWRADREALGWHVRFTPPLAGVWELVAVDGAMRSAPVKLMVTADAGRGFARVDGSGFRFDDGTPFVPIGPELAEGELDDYREWLARLERDGATAARLRLNPEWTIPLEQAWLIDKILELAVTHSIGIMLTLGDRLTASSIEAARRLHYIGARWAAYPSLWSWEWWDETGANDAALVAWIADMTPVLRSVDPYDHPITTGYDSRVKTAIWGRPELDFASCRLAAPVDPVQVLPALAGKQRRIAAGQPVLLTQPGKEPESVWAAVFAGFAAVLTESGSGDRGLAEALRGMRLADTVPAVPLKGSALALVAPDRAIAWLRAPASVTVRGLTDGAYTATWYSVHNGQVLRAERVVAVRGAVKVASDAPAVVRLEQRSEHADPDRAPEG
jgi:hypothetical protein